jgi:hypothetical protein
MTATEKYQQLVDAGLIIPPTVSPPSFKFPTMLVQFPSVTTNGVFDRSEIEKVANAQLERNSK